MFRLFAARHLYRLGGRREEDEGCVMAALIARGGLGEELRGHREPLPPPPETHAAFTCVRCLPRSSAWCAGRPSASAKKHASAVPPLSPPEILIVTYRITAIGSARTSCLFRLEGYIKRLCEALAIILLRRRFPNGTAPSEGSPGTAFVRINHILLRLNYEDQFLSDRES